MSTRLRPVVSCDQCLAWGVPDRAGRCRLCSEFGARHPAIGPCLACARSMPLQKGHCRLCWCQTQLDRGAVAHHSPLLPFVQKVRHHQLFFARMPGPRDTVVKPPRRQGVGSGAPGMRRKQAPPVAGRPAPGPVQLRLTNDLRRYYRYGRIDLRRETVPDSPWLAWALHLAHAIAETRGWSDVIHQALNRNLVMLLAGHLEGERIRFSDYHPVLRDREGGLRHVTEVLATMDVLLDDRPDTFNTWLAGKLTDLNPAIRRDVERWARTLREGGRRVRRRDEATIRNHIYHLRAALTDWSQRYDHLREVTRDDVLTALTAHRGFTRARTLTALRSLFTWAKRDGLIFRNPTAGIKNGPREQPILQPLTADEINHAVTAATTPHTRLFIALAAVYAARHGDIRVIRLDDVDLGNRRITIAGRARHIDDLTHQVLAAWLDHRRQRWPNTANPYLLVSHHSAMGAEPVSHPWVGRLLRGLPATIERLRIDRQLDEALACGADPLHLAAVFDIHSSTAIRYATSARQLLQRPHETESPTSPRTRPSTPDNHPNEPLGSS